MPETASEHVVLLDEDGRSLGLAEKLATHHSDTPLHLAFSCYIFDAAGRLLITQRALSKKVFPGVWTNSVCGHPSEGERLEEAVRRRAERELGMSVSELRLVLPEFRYRAELDGIVENEICPVLVAVADCTPSPAADEVEAHEWVDWSEFSEGVLNGTRSISPWCRLQVQQLVSLGSNPSDWPTAPESQLPPALNHFKA